MSRKLKRPPVPHADATAKVLAKLRGMSSSQVRETFIKAGILDAEGKVTKRYGGEGSKTPAAKTTTA